MPSKSGVLYTPVDPISPPSNTVRERHVVEAPGTAPGSEWFITTAIYCHSRRTGRGNIWRTAEKKKPFRASFRALAPFSSGSSPSVTNEPSPSLWRRLILALINFQALADVLSREGAARLV
jgi:hypothetical protein